MEIVISKATGSQELAPILQSCYPNVNVTWATVAEMPFGDFAFPGCGPDGSTVSVGFERKRLRDMLQSMRSGRFTSHQLPGMCHTYSPAYLLIEGQYSSGPQGILQEYVAFANRKRPDLEMGRIRDVALGHSGQAFMYAELDKFLMTIELKTPMKIRRTTSPHETAAFLWDAWHWWQKPWEQHQAHEGMAKDQTPSFRKHSLLRRWAAELPQILDVRSKAVANMFDTPLAMANATLEQWMSIDGIGPKMAKVIWRAIRGM